MDISKIRKKISQKYVTARLETADGIEELKFPLLTTGDWAAIKEATGVDIWDILLTTSSQSEQMRTSKLTKEQLEATQREMTVNLLRKITPQAQQIMLWTSLKKADANITAEDVDYITSYGMNQAEYMKVVNFLLYGVSSEQIETLTEEADTKKDLSENIVTEEEE